MDKKILKLKEELLLGLENNKNPVSSWADWESYWNSVDFNEREGRLNTIEFYMLSQAN